MASIKVTGYLDSEELPKDYVDLTHKMGLTEKGFEALTDVDGSHTLSELDDISFELMGD